LNHTSAARLAETYEETRRLLENGGSPPPPVHSELRSAAPREPKRHPKQLCPDQIDELVAGYQSGITAKALAAKFDIHRGTVAAHLERRGIPRPRINLLTPEHVEEANDLRLHGLGYAMIAARLGVSSMASRC
jgi:hypothetical protein